MGHHKKPERISPLALNMPSGGMDSHCHLDSEEFDNDREEVIERAHAAGVSHMFNLFTGIDKYERGRHYFDGHPDIYFAMGIFPTEAFDANEENLEKMRRIFLQDDRLKAVGEIGLDFYWKDCPKEIQYAAFRAQLEMAKELGKPVVIHCRDAFDDTMMILESAGFAGYPLLWHCFGGDLAMAKRILHNGWHISLPGPITYKANAAVREAVPHIPADRLILETDAPYLSAVPWRGTRNEPAFTVFTAECAAQLRNESREELWLRSGDNARRFFGIDS